MLVDTISPLASGAFLVEFVKERCSITAFRWVYNIALVVLCKELKLYLFDEL